MRPTSEPLPLQKKNPTLQPRAQEHCSDWRLLCDHKDPAWTSYWASRYEAVATAFDASGAAGSFEDHVEWQYWEHFQQYWFYLWRQLQARQALGAGGADAAGASGAAAGTAAAAEQDTAETAQSAPLPASLEEEIAATQQRVASEMLTACHAVGLGARQVDAPAVSKRYRGIHLRFTDEAEQASRVYLPSGGLDLKPEGATDPQEGAEEGGLKATAPPSEAHAAAEVRPECRRGGRVPVLCLQTCPCRPLSPLCFSLDTPGPSHRRDGVQRPGSVGVCPCGAGEA